MLQTLERPPIEAIEMSQLPIEEQYTPTLRDRIAGSKMVRMGVAAAASLGFGGVAAETAMADTTTVTGFSGQTFAALGESHYTTSDIDSGKVTFGEYLMAKGVSKKKIHHAAKNGDCEWIGKGTKVPNYYNSLRGANGKIFFYKDTKRAYACDFNGVWRKVKGSGPNHGNCGNIIKFHKPNEVVTGKIIAVINLVKATLRLHSEALAEAQARCESPDHTVSATAYGKGYASSDVYESLKKTINTRGNTLIRLSGQIYGDARSQASADAVAHCNETPAQQNQTTTTQTQEFKEICTQKDFVESFDGSGNISTTGSVNINDTVVWRITDWACNGSQNIDNWNVKDVLPQGSTFIGSSMPMGSQVNNSTRTATWPGRGTLTADGAPVTFTFDSQVNADTPCYTNLQNDEWSTAVGWNTAYDNAFIKLNNTNQANNCPPPPSGNGPGQ